MTIQEAINFVDIARMNYICDPQECGLEKGKDTCTAFHCDEMHDALAMAIEALERVEGLEAENKRLESKYEKLFSDFVTKASEYEQLKAENETLMQKNTSEYKLNEALLLRADRFEAERNELKFENEKLKSECNKYWCKADCNECDHRCRAWQNGYNAKQDIDGAIDKAIEALEFLYEVKNTKSDRS